MIGTQEKSIKYAEEDGIIVSWRKVNSEIASVFVLLILVVFPLAFKNYYWDILIFKYKFYYVSVLLLIVAVLANLSVYLYKDAKLYEWKNSREAFKRFSLKKVKISEWAMSAFLVSAIISTLQSEYLYEAFWGNEGRYCGLFIILLYGVSFFIITRCFHFKQWYLDAFLVAGLLASIIGIMQYFNYDPIGFKVGLSPEDYKMFASTIGNINTYTAYIALVTGVSMVLFCVEKNLIRKVWYFIAVSIFILALITGISDNAYLTLLALFGCLPLYLFVNVKGVKHYMVLVSVMFSEFYIIDMLNNKYPNHVIGIEGLFEVISGVGYLPQLILCLLGATLILHVMDVAWANKKSDRKDGNIGRWIWLGFMILVMVVIIYIVIDVNIYRNIDKYGAIGRYALFDDNWGSTRGYIWRVALEIYDGFPIIHKLFGYGPDTFGILTVHGYYEEMTKVHYQKFDSPHNEYLQYLLTMGVTGFISYLTFLMTSLYQMIRNAKKNPMVLAVVFAVLCYSAQAMVNIVVPIVAPIMLTLLMVGISVDNSKL